MKILFLQKRLLFPTDTGGKIRTLNVIRHLAKWHDVTYLSNILESEQPHAQDMRDLNLRLETIPWDETQRWTWKFYRELAGNLVSPYPYNVAKDYDIRLRSRAEQLLKEESYDLLICDFVQMARNCLGLQGCPQILFQHNVEAQIFERHSQKDKGAARRQYMKLQWKKMRKFEGEAGSQFDHVIAVSDADREKYEADYGWKHVSVIDTAVDVDYFRPDPSAQEQPDSMVFVGSMDWLPNQGGILHFVQNVWPAIRRRRPNAVFKVVGRNPTDEIRALGNVDGVEVLGTVPDTRPFLNEASLVVVPLLVGGGTRLKIFEAMAMERAIVSTPLGAEGLDVVSGKNIMLAEANEEFADAVVQLLEQEQKRKAMASAARELVLERYTAETVARQFDAICQRVVNGKQAAA